GVGKVVARQFIRSCCLTSVYFTRLARSSGSRKWSGTQDDAPFAVEITSKQGAGDEWFARKIDGSISHLSTTQLAKQIAKSLVEMAIH
ncbi:MAG: hypothetical protein D3916_16500, partial [Candidatus Electrothrix sp. MAN1_4]|nr:hypothetical protein [Candidatus Electrothrix sp. MAN1_4]